jgi:hypothetical protein
MRPKRPHIATLDQIRITRTSEGAVIEYLDPAILPVVMSVGADADCLSDAEILEHYNTRLREAEARTKGRHTSGADLLGGEDQPHWREQRVLTLVVSVPTMRPTRLFGQGSVAMPDSASWTVPPRAR